MRAHQIMTRQVITVGSDTPIIEAANLMLQNRISGLPVIDGAGKLIGIVSESDFLHRAETGTQRKRGRLLQLLVGTGKSASEFVHKHGRKVSDVMTRNVHLASPDQTIREAATEMAKADIGSLPVGENDRLIGMITDRDIVLRAVAQGRDPKTHVRDVMSERIEYCFEDEDVGRAAENMASLGVRRLPVLNRDKRLVGIVALSNIADSGDNKATSKMLKGVAEPHH